MPLPSGYTVLLTDTVGFIQDLPTSLIAAFRSTLEEAGEADVILHVVDSADPNYIGHEKTVKRLLSELEINHIPVITLYNKKDELHQNFIPFPKSDFLMTSAFEESDLLRIKEAIETKMKKEMDRYRVEIPPSEGKLLTLLKTETLLAKMEFLEDKFVYDCAGYIFTHSSLNVQLKRFLVEEGENKNV
ncbi:50S ribosomal subunit-associated GTPase HflX [Bacillus thuringiensis]